MNSRKLYHQQWFQGLSPERREARYARRRAWCAALTPEKREHLREYQRAYRKTYLRKDGGQ